MELNKYISEVIIEISEGINNAQTTLSDKGISTVINPSDDGKGNLIYYTPSNDNVLKRNITELSFNVNTTIEKKEGSSAGIGVLSGVISLGGKSEKEKVNESMNSLNFSIKVAFPTYGMVKSVIGSDGLMVRKIVEFARIKE